MAPSNITMEMDAEYREDQDGFSVAIPTVSAAVCGVLFTCSCVIACYIKRKKSKRNFNTLKRLSSDRVSNSYRESSGHSGSSSGYVRLKRLKSLSFTFTPKQKPDIKENCYLTRNGKVLCNEIMQTENEPYKDLGCLLCSMLDEETKVGIQKLQVPHEDIKFLSVAGQGHFGKVWEGIFTHKSQVKKVAIKTIKDTSSQEHIRKFMTEALMMSDLDHPHIIKVLGVAVETEMGLPMILMPFMANKDLHMYLRRARIPDSEHETELRVIEMSQMIVFAFQIARGMEYLHSQRYLHRDLATRNCMLDDQLRVYIADFGLIKDVYAENHYQTEPGAKLPIRWMAIEVLSDRLFSMKSDVWSYGIVLWEIMSLGQIPYQSLENCNILQFLTNGGRLEEPENSPPELVSIMKQCWSTTPRDRPSFKQIVERLDAVTSTELNYLQL